MSKVLFIGPLPSPYTGQSIAFSYLKKLDSKQFQTTFFDTQRFNNKFLNYFFSWFVLPFKIAFSGINLIYLSSSRTHLGFIRQIPIFLMAKLMKIKLINHLQGADFKSFYTNSNFLKPAISYCYNTVDTSIVLLEGMKNEYVNFPKMKIVVVPNAFDENFDRIDFKPNLSKNIIYLSNLMASKGILEFLKAAGKILDEFSDSIITIAGKFIPDHLLNVKEVEIEFFKLYTPLKNKFGNRINYKGLVVGNDKIDLLMQSSIFVLPTFYPTEGLPLSIVEAMRTNNVIISTNHNYLDELVSEKNGFLIKPESFEEIFIAVKKIVEDDKKIKQIQKYNFNFSNEKYNIKAHLKSIKTEIENLIQD